MKTIHFLLATHVFVSALLFWGTPSAIAESSDQNLKLGWAEVDITPDKPVVLTGVRAVRVTDEVKDPLTATVLVLESTKAKTPVRMALISLDLINASEAIRDEVRERVARDVPDVPPEAVVFFATHTHTAPVLSTGPRYRPDFTPPDEPWIFQRSNLVKAIEAGEVETPMTCREYVDLVVERVGDAVVEAWNGRVSGAGLAFGKGNAQIGRNRVMSGQGIENDQVLFMGTYDAQGKLVGLMLNLPAPAQADVNGREISADFIHETREELRRRFGEDLFVLPQLSAVGDMNPLRDRQRNAERIADAVGQALPDMAEAIDSTPVLRQHFEILELPRWELLRQGRGDPEAIAIEVHALRLGDAAMVTNPFELFLDYGLAIQEGSRAGTTFVVQLAGPGSYLPTERAVEHGGYGASRGPREVGPESGAKLVDWSVNAISDLWD